MSQCFFCFELCFLFEIKTIGSDFKTIWLQLSCSQQINLRNASWFQFRLTEDCPTTSNYSSSGLKNEKSKLRCCEIWLSNRTKLHFHASCWPNNWNRRHAHDASVLAIMLFEMMVFASKKQSALITVKLFSVLPWLRFTMKPLTKHVNQNAFTSHWRHGFCSCLMIQQDPQKPIKAWSQNRKCDPMGA